MPSPLLLNSVRFATSTTGTGTVNVGAAETGYLTPAEAGAVSGAIYSYRIDDGDDFEIGLGTYTDAGTDTFSRDTVTVSKIGGTAGTTKLNLSGTAKMGVVARTADIATPGRAFSAAILFGTP